MPKAMQDDSSQQPVLLEIAGPIAIISNNRPDVHNATSDAFNRRLWEIFYELHLRDDIRCVVWRGNGKSFSSGRDLRELGGARDGGMSHLQHIERGHGWTQMLFTCPAPIIVALKGWVIGGMFERALLCDLRVAGERRIRVGADACELRGRDVHERDGRHRRGDCCEWVFV